MHVEKMGSGESASVVDGVEDAVVVVGVVDVEINREGEKPKLVTGCCSDNDDSDDNDTLESDLVNVGVAANDTVIPLSSLLALVTVMGRIFRDDARLLPWPDGYRW